jgi:pantoate--beta-alanine ligase
VLERIETIAALRARLARDTGLRALVPTMGALHEGHAALITRARAESQTVVVSIFVNPLQFDNRDDLSRYPQTLDADLALCRRLDVDIVFCPSAAEVYPQPPECTVDVGKLGNHLCGKFRPGHFRGVATVVLKLFEMVQPHRAYFGEKDAQQLAIVERLVEDFNVPVSIVEVATVREPDGLAISSRNRQLSAAQRTVAVCLYRALLEAKRVIEAGEVRSERITQASAALIPASDDVRLEYLELVDPATLQPVEDISGDVRIAGAIWVGHTRLIDNLLVRR